MRLFDLLKDKNQLIDENMKMRKINFDIEQRLDGILLELEETKSKYINLLEQKSEKFDLYIKYQDQCIELTSEKKDLKRQLAENIEHCNILTDENAKLVEKIEKLQKRIIRIENKYEKKN